ncbi:MAG TPA: thioredoxin family protein [Patescibacteria group bacterium]|nr:thioredoxin family protein [Patescibacteria group bacterium]
MPVRTADDDQLRHLIYSHDYAVIKYTSPTCEVCQALGPHYHDLSEQGKYSNFLFLKIDAEENPIAKQFLAERATPLMVTYKHATVLEADTVYTIEDMVKMLDKLMAVSQAEA